MVSPLQTWQHLEPKRLWFILGGLSVLAHIGLLGLSLPYVLRLMEPSAAAVSTLPIELITVDPVSGQPIENADSESFSASATSTAQPETATATNPPPASNSGDPSPPTDPTSFSNQASTNSPAPTTSPNRETSDTATSPAPTPPSNSQRPTRPTQPPTETETGSGTGTGEGTGNNSEDASEDGSGDGSSDSLPSLPGSGQLQPPGSDGTSTTVQVAALRVTGTRLDAVQDVKEQPPQLLSSTAAIALEPERVGCDRIDFSSGPLGPLTYRVAIDTDNSIRTLTLQTEGGSSVSPANEGAVACLIRSAGFSFSAAVSDGTPILDDSLLLTLDVIESQSDTAP